MFWSCIALLFGFMLVADLFQSSVRILSPRYLSRVIPVCTYMLRLLDPWNDIIPSSFPSPRGYALSHIFVAIHCRTFAKHSKSTQKPSEEILT